MAEKKAKSSQAAAPKKAAKASKAKIAEAVVLHAAKLYLSTQSKKTALHIVPTTKLKKSHA